MPVIAAYFAQRCRKVGHVGLAEGQRASCRHSIIKQRIVLIGEARKNGGSPRFRNVLELSACYRPQDNLTRTRRRGFLAQQLSEQVLNRMIAYELLKLLGQLFT